MLIILFSAERIFVVCAITIIAIIFFQRNAMFYDWTFFPAPKV